MTKNFKRENQNDEKFKKRKTTKKMSFSQKPGKFSKI